MSDSLQRRRDQIFSRLRSVGQEHVLHFWGRLDDDARAELLADIERIDLAELPELARQVTHYAAAAPAAHLAPPAVITRDAIGEEVARHGAAILAEGRVAALTVAGGQGTRLGFDGPKGAYPISPLKHKTLFQLFAESIRATDRRYECRTRWYIMTSDLNDDATRQFFDRHGHFGLDPDQIRFFRQGLLPAFDPQGKILLDQPHRLALAPDGHGGTIRALAKNGLLDEMQEAGVEFLSYFQVDNPLVYCLDPTFVALHERHGSEMSSKTVPKADDLEKVGVFASADGKLTVIEYSDFPEELARARNPDGSRRFDAANVAIHLFSRAFLQRLSSSQSHARMPWHLARKKVPCVDLSSGNRVEPDAPNACKLEAFIFDALPLANNPILMAARREEEFSPVKNLTGVDSADTARRDLVRRAARWLDAAGKTVPRGADGEPRFACEISPLFALDEGQFVARRLLVPNVPRDRDCLIEQGEAT